MAVEYFNRTAGSDVMQGKSDPSMLCVGSVGVGDLVRIPAQLGGGERRVERVRHLPCPCGCGRTVRHLALHEYSVAECSQFFWYRTPNHL